jgi:hypothetical protein
MLLKNDFHLVKKKAKVKVKKLKTIKNYTIIHAAKNLNDNDSEKKSKQR